MNCPCCSNKLYSECCQPYHNKEKYAPTAEVLMRSRFSAFAIPNGDYLMNTTLPAKRKFHTKEELQEWGEINQWIKLEIVNVPTINQVEFKALYRSRSKPTTASRIIGFSKNERPLVLCFGRISKRQLMS